MFQSRDLESQYHKIITKQQEKIDELERKLFELSRVTSVSTPAQGQLGLDSSREAELEAELREAREAQGSLLLLNN